MNKKRAFLLFFAPFFVVSSLQANILFPVQLILAKPGYLLNPIIILLALVIEFWFIKKITRWSIKDCIVADIVMNIASSLFGTILIFATTRIPLTQYAKGAQKLAKTMETTWTWDTWMTNILKGLWQGEFAAVEVMFWGSVLIMAIVATNALIEATVLRSLNHTTPSARNQKPLAWTTIFVWIGLANLITTALQIASLALGTVPNVFLF